MLLRGEPASLLPRAALAFLCRRSIYIIAFSLLLVPRVGLEPTNSCERQILNLLCKPFHHQGSSVLCRSENYRAFLQEARRLRRMITSRSKTHHVDKHLKNLFQDPIASILDTLICEWLHRIRLLRFAGA